MNVIIGYGVVGQNVAKIFRDADLHDPAKNLRAKGTYEVGFVCVPTDSKDDGAADTSIVEAVVKEWRSRCKVLCIRSTVPPGTTFGLDGPCVFSPEYYGGTQHANAVDYDFVVLGGPRHLANIVAEQYKEVYPASLRIYYTDSTTAELVKYMENSWLATKVTFCNEFYRIAQAFNLDYDEVRELWLNDPRVNRSHTFVYRNHPYYDSHCLNKDVPAIINASVDKGFTPEFLYAMMMRNNEFKVKME